MQATIVAMGSHQFPQNQKIKNIYFKKVKASGFGDGELFSTLTSCLNAKQLLPIHIVKHGDVFDGLFKIKEGNADSWRLLPTMLRPILYVSPLRCSTVRYGISWIIRRTARTSHPVVFTCFFTSRDAWSEKSSVTMLWWTLRSWHGSRD